MKFTDTMITFSEVPDEISLCINISNCPNHCPGCHSKELWENIGEELTEEKLRALIAQNKGISCVCFMGGDAAIKELPPLAKIVKENNLKTCWYSGRKTLSLDLDLKDWDYIKLGPYIENYGPLDNPNTNQRFYKVKDERLINITDKFWK